MHWKNNYLIPSDTKGQVKLICPYQWDKSKKQWKSKWDVIEYSPIAYTPQNINWLIKTIQDNLTIDMVAEKYLQGNLSNPLFGHCYHSTQTIFYLIDTDWLMPMRGLDAVGEYHWYLKDKTNQEIVDATVDQYSFFDYPPPYDNGKKTDWYSFKKAPIRKTLDLIQKIQSSSIRYTTQNPFDSYNTLTPFL